MATKVSLIPFVREFENFLEQILGRVDIEEIWEHLDEIEERLEKLEAKE